ncbi:glycosyltransferase [Vibrio cyclitrophicus]|uniref:glycosyltransferase n=1 Tax=Vibrio cyclitrophicus TaxID=47951 RepID=UPI00031D8D06|nr:glycosyltransferase [Vibrio cyclitrophicus]OEF25267.1 hypothetical protein OA9_16235 [Vibrio cyclitrophicus 1F97]
MKAIFITTSKIGANSQGDYIYSTQIYNGLKKISTTELYEYKQNSNYLLVLLFFFLPMMWVRNFSFSLCLKLFLARRDYGILYVDHYRCAWVAFLAKLLGKKCYIFNHNLESSVYKSLLRSKDASVTKRLFSLVEYTKVFLSELAVLRLINGLVSISGEDIPHWVKVKKLVLPPYSQAPTTSHKRSSMATAIIIGSFHWRLKQHNLQVFLDSFYEVYKTTNQNCSIIVAGSAPTSFYNVIEGKYPFVKIIDGFENLEDLSGLADLGVCPDQAGGGFKLKTLDYHKIDLPMVAIEGGASGILEPVVPSFNDFQLLAKEVHVLLEDGDRRDTLLAEQRRYFLKFHSVAAFLDKLKSFS